MCKPRFRRSGYNKACSYLERREQSEVDWVLQIVHYIVPLLVLFPDPLSVEYETTAGSAQGLVRRARHNVGVFEGVVNNTRRNQPWVKFCLET